MEDSPLEATVATRALEAAFDVRVFAEATAMLEALSCSTPPAALVLDWYMPGLPGIEVCRFIRTTRSQNELPIVMLTAVTERRELVAAMSAGANDYLTKPYDSAELLARVAAAVRTKQLHARLVEAELRERAACLEAEAANLAKDQFLALASHELRTPLNAILGWIQLMEQGRLDAAGQARAVETIGRNAKAQVQLIEDILDASRVAAGQAGLVVTPLDFGSILRAAGESIRPALEKKNITLTLDLDGEDTPLDGDAARMAQIIGKLLGNALKFTSSGGHVDVRTWRVDGSLALSVRDDGDGIASELLPHVFDRFHQVEGAPARRHGGLGIGLSLVRHFVEAHGGTVVAASEGLGCGSTFVVMLPVARVTRRERAGKSDAADADEAHESRAPGSAA